MDDALEELIVEAFQKVDKGSLNKVQLSTADRTITAYRVGTVIRIDIKHNQ